MYRYLGYIKLDDASCTERCASCYSHSRAGQPAQAIKNQFFKFLSVTTISIFDNYLHRDLGSPCSRPVATGFRDQCGFSEETRFQCANLPSFREEILNLTRLLEEMDDSHRQKAISAGRKKEIDVSCLRVKKDQP